MSEKYSFPFEVEVSVLNKDGLLTPVGYQKAIITATEKELKRIKLSVPEMIRRFGVTWILLSLCVKVIKPVKVGSVLTVTTWHTWKKGVLFRREFEISDESGQRVAIGASFSSIIDLNKRRICMDRAVYDALQLEEGEELFEAKSKAVIEGDFEFCEEIAVRPSWIDSFDHVNNFRYGELAFDNLPINCYENLKNLSSISLYFMGELRLGESVKISRKVVENAVEVSGVHSKDNRQAFFAKLEF